MNPDSDPLEKIFVTGDELHQKLISGELIDPLEQRANTKLGRINRASVALYKELQIAKRQRAKLQQKLADVDGDIAEIEKQLSEIKEVAK